MPRTPRSQWPALFNPFGRGIVHMELFLGELMSVNNPTLFEAIALYLFPYGTHAARPSAANMPLNAIFYETDTTNLFQNQAGTWVQIASIGGGGGGGVTSLSATSPIAVDAATGAVDISHEDTVVTPGTYGDASNVAQVTVDQQGHITDIQDVPITAGGAGDLLDYIYIAKASDESVTSSTTFQDDDDFTHAIGANETWVVDIYPRIIGARAAGMKFAFTWPTGATVTVSASGPASGFGTSGTDIVEGLFRTQQIIGVTSGSIAGLLGLGDNSGNALMAHIRVRIENGATPGNLTLQWAQNASSGTATTMKAGSDSEWKRFA